MFKSRTSFVLLKLIVVLVFGYYFFNMLKPVLSGHRAGKTEQIGCLSRVAIDACADQIR
jgi:hypothetical protein